jgi:hypothetical protein
MDQIKAPGLKLRRRADAARRSRQRWSNGSAGRARVAMTGHLDRFYGSTRATGEQLIERHEG